MIWFVYGVPRTGKSLFGGLVDAVIPALKKGRKVFTNIPGLSPAGLSVFCDKTPLEILHLLHPVNNLGDVFACFDFQSDSIRPEYVDSVFILDEFRSMVGLTTQTEIQFTKILNKAGKSAVDFYLIAQLPSYFDDDTRKLGEGCTVYERGDRMGRKNSSIEFLFDKNAGTPYKLGKKWDTEHWQYRYRDPKYFHCYSSYVDQQFMSNRGEDHKTLKFWQSKSFKLGCIIFGIVVIMIIIAFSLLNSTSKTLDKLTNEKQTKKTTTQLEQINKVKIDNSDIDEKICYTQVWINDGVATYKLNNGSYAYNPTYLIERCSRQLTRKTDKNF